MSEILLTTKQVELLTALKKSKDLFQKELNKVLQRENDCIVMLTESNGVTVDKDTKIELKENKLIIS